MMTRLPIVLTLLLSLLAAGPAVAADLPTAKPEQVGLSPERLERAERVYRPLKMIDTTFLVPADKRARIAQPLPTHPDTGAEYKLADPVEVMVVVSMMPSPLGRHYQQLVRALVLQAIGE